MHAIYHFLRGLGGEITIFTCAIGVQLLIGRWVNRQYATSRSTEKRDD